MKKTLKQRKTYFIISTIFFIVGFIMYGAAGSTMSDEWQIFENQTPFLLFLVYGLTGGNLIFGVSSGIMLFASFIKSKSLGFKITTAILFPITFIVIVYTGVLGGIPYAIYNIVQIYKMSKNHKKETENE